MKSLRDISLYTFLIVAFIAGSQIPAISVFVGAIGYVLFLFFLLGNKLENAFTTYLIFMSCSIEMGYFATGDREATVYSFVLMPLIRAYGMLLVNILLYAKLLGSYSFVFVNKSKYNNLRFLHNSIYYMLFVGLAVVFITLIVNDNNVNDTNWYYGMIISEVYRFLILFLTTLNCIMLIARNPRYVIQLETAIINLLIALVPSAIIAMLLGFKGYRGDQDDLSMLPLFSYFSLSLFAFLFYRRYKHYKRIILIFAILLLAIMLYRPSPLGGKWFLSIVIVLFLIIYKRFSFRFSVKNIVILIFSLFAFVFVFENFLFEMFVANNEYFMLKYTETIDLLDYLGGGGGSGSGGNFEETSPAFRIEELINIVYEYIEKPAYFLTGKGLVGSITHLVYLTSWDGVGAFSIEQQSSGIYVRVHETLNVILLKYGLIGFVGLAHVIILSIKGVRYSPWGVIGLLWVLFYVGAYQSMFVGLISLILALYYDDIKSYKSCEII